MKYVQDILDKGIYFKDDNLKFDPYPAEILSYKKLNGYCVYQHPLQLSALLEWLEDKDIKSYLEIGVFFGGTFRYIVEFLKSKNPDTLCIGVDIKAPTNQIKEMIAKEAVHFLQGNTTKGSTVDKVEDLLEGHPLDLCFIDGNHNYSVIVNDWVKYGQYAKYCLFHDIYARNVPDVARFWNEFIKPKYKTMEFDQTYEGHEPHFGIGLVIN
jgi:cephalosporin hydroxylase